MYSFFSFKTYFVVGFFSRVYLEECSQVCIHIWCLNNDLKMNVLHIQSTVKSKWKRGLCFNLVSLGFFDHYRIGVWASLSSFPIKKKQRKPVICVFKRCLVLLEGINWNRSKCKCILKLALSVPCYLCFFVFIFWTRAYWIWWLNSDCSRNSTRTTFQTFVVPEEYLRNVCHRMLSSPMLMLLTNVSVHDLGWEWSK